uniref:Phosphatidylinositol 4-phosphate 3-kinase C2 domain-containing subunit beta-like n=1 Tax=Saccoglossus kowalevskii TaxID=10224 RepID=A0ABM0LVG9_SACKO|nr:PREDICTED: phosphatidylinositol 4-phosphate 3-kinase C2 domain-containing subunit beta-like [Saccoglossus kowalevskii]
MNIKPVSSLYEQDLQELFGPTSATTASATTTGVSSNANDQKLLTTTAAHVPQDPWSLDLAIQSQSLPNSTKVSQKIKVTLNENVKANDISGLHHSHSGSSIASAFQAQSESHSQKQSANTGMPSSFVNYMPSSKSAWNQTQGSHTVLDGLPEFSSSLPAVCSKTNVTPTPVRPLSRKQSSNVTTSCMTSISSTTVSTSEPSGNFLQSSWQDFDLGLSAFKSPAKAAPSSAITSSKALVFDNKHNVSTTKQAFVWTGRDQSSQAPSIRVTSTLGNQCNIARESEMTSNSMDDIIREFDTLDLGPAHRKSGRQEISPPEMYPLRQSSSEGNLSSVSWMDFDPLSSTSNVTTNSSLSQADPSSLPSYDESQRNASTTLPQVRRTPSPSCMYLPSAEAHVKKPPGRPSPPKSPVSPSRPKSPASRKSQVPPKRPKSPRPHTLHGAERPQARTKAPNRSSTWRPVSLAMGAIDSAKAERVFFGDGLFDLAEEKDEEAKAFSASIISFRSVYEYDNRTTNPGHVMSAVFQHPYSSGFESSVKIILLSSHAEHPVTFSCDVSTSVQHIISQAVYMLSEDFSDVPIEDFTLKIYGLAEYLYNVNFSLFQIQDDQNILVTNFTQLFEHPLTTTVSKQGLVVLLEAFNSEVKKVREHVRDPSIQAHPNKVIQTVKAICATLATVEPNNITRVYEELKSTTSLHIGSTLNNLTAAVQNLMDMYCKAFDTGHTLHTKVEDLLKLPVTDIHDEFHIKIASVHRLPLRWKSSFEHFTLSCAIFYGGTPLYRTLTTKTSKITTNFFDKISFDQVLNFSLPLCKLPRETRICFTLFGTSVSNSDNKQPTRKALGWVTVPLFNFKSVMLDGSHLFGLWPDDKASPIGTCASNILQAHSVIIQVDFPKYDGDVIFPPVEKTHLLVKDYEDLDQDVKTKIRQILKKDTLARLVEHENKLIWNNRHYLHALPNALPWLLRVVESWDWSSLGDLYSLLHHWTPLEPVDALQLLHPQFADCEVRVMAVSYIQCLSDDELCDYLPQLVQALKYENYHDSALARFLIERSLTSIRVAHYLYWHLKDCVCDQQFSQRFQMVLGALLCTSGEAIRDQFQRQDEFMTKLGEVAEIVKKHKDSIRQVILHRKLEPIAQKYTKNLRLPLSPSYDVGILNVKELKETVDKIIGCGYLENIPTHSENGDTEPEKEEVAVETIEGDEYVVVESEEVPEAGAPEVSKSQKYNFLIEDVARLIHQAHLE